MPAPLVLVVDDEPLISRLVQVNLQHKGYNVRCAKDGLAALESLRSGGPLPDLILLDIEMPYMDGFSLLSRLRETEELRAIPVVIMSALNRDADQFRARDLGALQYLNKPVNPLDLLKIVATVIGVPEKRSDQGV